MHFANHHPPPTLCVQLPTLPSLKTVPLVRQLTIIYQIWNHGHSHLIEGVTITHSTSHSASQSVTQSVSQSDS